MEEYTNERLFWEDEAHSTLERLLDQIVYDDVRGTLRIPDFNAIKRDFGVEFGSLEDFSQHLGDIYNQEWYTYVPFEGGTAVFESDPYGAVDDAITDRPQINSFFDRHSPPSDDKLITADELLLPNAEASRVVRISLEEINEELIAYLAAHPEKMRDLSPRKFEELVADMWRNQGFEVTLTPSSRDGGMDVIAVRKNGVGTVMIIIECKRYAATNKVGVEIVRGLYGVVEQKRATQGIIATTSYFTKGVEDFRNEVPYRIGLSDFGQISKEIQGWRDANNA